MMLERLKRLNIFARVKELERMEGEKDKALELMLIHLEAIQVYLEKRIKVTNEQNVRLDAVVGYNLNIKNDLDVT